MGALRTSNSSCTRSLAGFFSWAAGGAAPFGSCFCAALFAGLVPDRAGGVDGTAGDFFGAAFAGRVAEVLPFTGADFCAMVLLVAFLLPVAAAVGFLPVVALFRTAEVPVAGFTLFLFAAAFFATGCFVAAFFAVVLFTGFALFFATPAFFAFVGEAFAGAAFFLAGTAAFFALGAEAFFPGFPFKLRPFFTEALVAGRFAFAGAALVDLLDVAMSGEIYS